MRIGLFGGTFNPVHHGHLKTARDVYEHFDLNKLLFIPTYLPPHKLGEDIVSPEVRLDMLRLAVSGHDGFCVSDVEIIRGDISYSIDTVKAFKAAHPDDRIFFILGADAFYEINTWKGYEEFLFLVDFIVMTRPGFSFDHLLDTLSADIINRFRLIDGENRYESDSGTSIHFHEVTRLDISSTGIRALVHQGKSIAELVPPPVEEYIRVNGLYR